MTDNLLKLRRLLATMREHFVAGPGFSPEIIEESRRVLSELPDDGAILTEAVLLCPSAHPIRAQARAAVREAGPVWDEALSPLVDLLPWRFTYAPRSDYPDLENKMAWAEIVGPAAPIHSDRVGFGLTVISGGVFYPPHNHPATELYAVASGVSEWTLEGRALRFGHEEICPKGVFEEGGINGGD
ncbi:hypothetical protein FACS1894205_7130 [Alphaproteobacteria bacterium]|nr:hypothetical protein FACS1894205_7130 [Alphaproteobacteria bacterium]